MLILFAIPLFAAPTRYTRKDKNGEANDEAEEEVATTEETINENEGLQLSLDKKKDADGNLKRYKCEIMNEGWHLRVEVRCLFFHQILH